MHESQDGGRLARPASFESDARADDTLHDFGQHGAKAPACDSDQNITSQTKIDQWCEARTKGLTPVAKAQLKAHWGTLQNVPSSQSRLRRIVADILVDMLRNRLKSRRGNAILVAGSVYEACKCYELFAKTRS